MSHFLDRLTFFKRIDGEFSDGHGITTNEDRALGGRLSQALAARQDRALDPRRELHRLLLLEDLRQGRHRHLGDAADRLSAHAARPAQPRAARLLARRELQLVSLFRQPREISAGARAAAQAVARGARRQRRRWRPGRRSSRTRQARATTPAKRGRGGFVRATWDEVTEIIAAANAYTIKTYGPDRVVGFSPIPAMSMVSYAAGSRYLSLLGGVCMSFYDWYCDLPPSSPQTWGEQTDVPESADWYNAGFLHPLGLERPADAHAGRALLHRGPLQGRQERRHLPRLFRGRQVRRPVAHPKQGTDAALALAMGHVILREFYLDRQARIFRRLRPQVHRHADAGAAGRSRATHWCPTGCCAPPTSPALWARPTIPTGRRSPIDETRERSSCRSARSASAGARRASGTSRRRTAEGREISLRLTLRRRQDELAAVAFPYFGNRAHDHFAATDHRAC